MNKVRKEHFSLQYISYPDQHGDHMPGILSVLEGGGKWIQLRMKNCTLDEIEQVAIQVKTLCEKFQATFILNDHPELVSKLDLDGVHIGKKDIAAHKARTIIGEGKILGRTCNSIKDLLETINLPIDYIGFGPYKFTTTKAEISDVLGQNIFGELNDLSKTYNLKPIVGIGGIEVGDIETLTTYGINGIAASGMLRNKTTEEIKNIVEEINHGFIKNRR